MGTWPGEGLDAGQPDDAADRLHPSPGPGKNCRQVGAGQLSEHLRTLRGRLSIDSRKLAIM